MTKACMHHAVQGVSLLSTSSEVVFYCQQSPFAQNHSILSEIVLAEQRI